jgi:hypothetical protein
LRRSPARTIVGEVRSARENRVPNWRRYWMHVALFAVGNALALFIIFRLGQSLRTVAGIQGGAMILASMSPLLAERILKDDVKKLPRYTLPKWFRTAEQTLFAVIGLALLGWAIWPR